MTRRIYSYKDVDMLMAAQTIAKNVKDNINDLSQVRSNWTSEWASGLQARIDETISTYLGLDKWSNLRRATTLLNQIQQPALKNLAFFRVQVKVDFKQDAIEILKTLGFRQPLRKLDQESLIELLYAFKKGMTPEMKAKIIAQGTNPALVETLMGYAAALEQANLTQEGLKASSRERSEKAVKAFNSIYTEVIGVCKIAAKYLASDPTKKEQFVFAKVVKRMGASTKKKEAPLEV